MTCGYFKDEDIAASHHITERNRPSEERETMAMRKEPNSHTIRGPWLIRILFANRRIRVRSVSMVLLLLFLACRPVESSDGLRGVQAERLIPMDLRHSADIWNPVFGSKYQRQAQMIEVRSVTVKASLALSFVDNETASFFRAGNLSEPVVYAFCNAINQQVRP